MRMEGPAVGVSYMTPVEVSTTRQHKSQLEGLHTALEYLINNSYHGLIISDFKAALSFLNDHKAVCNVTVNSMQST